MPRVNRDLQRRMAARRERERRRPTDRRYRFGTTAEPDITPEERALEEELEEEAVASAPAALGRRPVADSSGRGSAQRAQTHRPFTSYAAEYSYVVRDLRRIALVVGSLLVVLLVLYFALPH